MAHTPGPWRVVEDMRTGRTGEEYLAGYNIESDAAEIVGCEGIIPGDEAETNARLIASAPDLLEMLKELVEAFDDEVMGQKRKEQAEIVIAMAEGRL